MPSVEYDLRYVQAGMIDLEGYLFSKELFWPIGTAAPQGEPPYPRLTLGGLLLAFFNLEYRDMSEEQRAQVDQLQYKLEQTKTRWRTLWEQKAARNFSERLRLWANYLEDYRNNAAGNVDRYPYEVRRRVMLHLLAGEGFEVPRSEDEMLSGLDELLRSVFMPGPFVWEDELRGVYPQQTFWYLYGKPR